jgi:hypothetical protein
VTDQSGGRLTSGRVYGLAAELSGFNSPSARGVQTDVTTVDVSLALGS